MLVDCLKIIHLHIFIKLFGVKLYNNELHIEIKLIRNYHHCTLLSVSLTLNSSGSLSCSIV